ncbi:hypothetical protein ABH931_000693 [Streptacidiphilus sp. MAP12-33]|uniref:hypothetical protein n=1 Tax=Streptacidiphilus sp. MAP12-33 TaxID=3156266 RepID=UPI003517AB89
MFVRRRGVLPLSTGVAMLVAVTACGVQAGDKQPAPAKPPASDAELRTHLLPFSMANGWTAQPFPEGFVGGPDSSPECHFMVGQDLVDATTTGAVGSASAELTGPRNARGGSGGEEALYSFRTGGAHRAMQAMRADATHCTTVILSGSGTHTDTSTFTSVDGPHLGDESLVIRTVTHYSRFPGVAQRSDAIVVRVGDALVVISPMVPVYPADNDAVAALVPLAVAQLTSNHPQPVDTTNVPV